MSHDFYKAIVFSAHNEGRQFVDFIHTNSRGRNSLCKTAAEKEYSPEIMERIRHLKPQPGKTYPLISALGAGEFWSSNSNADYFEESQLNPEDPAADYGHKTFEIYAKPYKHHINKPDSPAYGEVMHSVYNPRMHRVELLVCLDDDLAPDIAERIEDGEDVPVSMGCKVPYDVCSICGRKAKSTASYCDHMLLTPNKQLSDGRKVFVFNVRPRFFDISFVFVGADRTARVMAKVASQRTVFLPPVQFPAGLWAHKMGYHLKGADIDKGADIIKEVPGSATDALKQKAPMIDRGVKSLAATEERIPDEVLDKAASASEGDFNGGLATFTQAGIVLAPAEFQRFMRGSMFAGEKTAQAALDHGVFDEHSYDQATYRQALEAYDFSVDYTLPKVANAIAPMLSARSAYQPFLGARAEAPLSWQLYLRFAQ